MALEKEIAGAKLPGFIALNPGNIVGAGYLDTKYSPFGLVPSTTGLPQSTHPDGQARFDTRFELLNSMDGSLRVNSPLGQEAESMAAFYQQARGLMYDPQVDATFKFTADERTRYGTSTFGDSCLVARNIVKSNLGARFIQIQLGGWDNHSNIYKAAYRLSRERTNKLSQAQLRQTDEFITVDAASCFNPCSTPTST